MVGSERLHADNRSGFHRRVVENQQKRHECESGNRRWKHPDPIVLYQPTFRTTLFYSWGSEPERRACGTPGRLKRRPFSICSAGPGIAPGTLRVVQWKESFRGWKRVILMWETI